MGQRKARRLTTYNCPYYKKLKTVTEPEITATESGGEKYYVVWHECGTIKLPYKTFLQYRDRYCASENVNGWRDCTLAQALEEYYKDRGVAKRKGTGL